MILWNLLYHFHYSGPQLFFINSSIYAQGQFTPKGQEIMAKPSSSWNSLEFQPNSAWGGVEDWKFLAGLIQ